MIWMVLTLTGILAYREWVWRKETSRLHRFCYRLAHKISLASEVLSILAEKKRGKK